MPAWSEWMTPADSFQPHPRPSHEAIFFDRFQGVLRTRRCVATGRRNPLRRPLIDTDHQDPEFSSHLLRISVIPVSRSAIRSACRMARIVSRADTTKSRPIRSSGLVLLTASRIRLTCRFRRAWQPIALDVAIPTNPLPGRQCSRKHPRETRKPRE